MSGSAAPFAERVYAIVERVPPGQVTTYGDVAAALGHPRSARRVGWALSRLSPERVDEVPWHRVINAKGTLSLRDDPVRGEVQRQRLEREGVLFDAAGRVDLPRLRCLPEDLAPDGPECR